MGSNVLEFYVKMKDMMSTGLVKMASQAKQSFKTVQTEYAKTKEKSEFLNKSVNELRYELKEVNKVRFGTVLASEFKIATQQAKVLEREISNVKHSAGGSVSVGRASRGGGGWMAGGVMGMLRGVLPVISAATLVTGVVDLAKASSGAYRENQLKSKTFEVLAGNAGVGQELSSRLLKDQQLLGKTVFSNAQTMMGFGIQAKDVEKDLLQLGSVAMGNTVRFKELTLAYSQTMAVGKLVGKDMRQFVNAGFNPLKTISEHWKEFGFKQSVTIGELQETIKKGKITADMVAKAFDIETGKGGRFAGMLDKIADTSAGKVMQLEGHYEALKIVIGEKLQPAIDTASVKMIGWIDKIKSWMDVPGQKQDDMISRIKGLQANLTTTNTTQADQFKILGQLKDINPFIVKGIDEQSISYSKLSDNINKVIQGLQSKKMEDMLSGKNADLLGDFEKNKKGLVSAKDNIYMRIAQIAPDVAADPSLSFGQKQLKAIAIAQAKIKAEGSLGVFTKHSDNLGNYFDLKGAINEWNTTNKNLATNMPEVRAVQNKLNAARAGVSQYMGLGVITPTKLNKPTKDDLAGGGGSGGSTARQIAEGGPRVINIHGVSIKMADHVEIYAKDPEDLVHQAEPHLKTMWLKVLNSGAKTQD